MGHRVALARQTGFSLLELLIVLGLMATAAVLALSSVGNRDNQNRFEETRNKLNVIRKAIVGEPLVINGQLNVNGFVADMGRLPLSLNELMVAPTDCDPVTAGNQTCPWAFDEDYEFWRGWHGPYINAIGADYRDGWGNVADTAGVTASTFDDAPENNGWDWDGATVTGALAITSVGLDRDVASDPAPASEDAPYGTSSLQTTTIAATEFSVQLPSAPLHLSVEPAPFCGQCRDDHLGHQTSANCASAGHTWNSDLLYCVENTATSAATCDAVTTEPTRWYPVFGRCVSPATPGSYNSNGSCTAAGGTWNAFTASTDCTTTIYPGSGNIDDFTNGQDEFCARPIRINHGQRASDTHKATDASFIDVTVAGADRQSSTGDDPVYAYQPTMETDAASPVAGLILPQGQFRIGLFIRNAAAVPPAPRCTNNPYPSQRGQALSDIITLSSKYAPNIGTLANPIPLRWKSQ